MKNMLSDVVSLAIIAIPIVLLVAAVTISDSLAHLKTETDKLNSALKSLEGGGRYGFTVHIPDTENLLKSVADKLGDALGSIDSQLGSATSELSSVNRNITSELTSMKNAIDLLKMELGLININLRLIDTELERMSILLGTMNSGTNGKPL